MPTSKGFCARRKSRVPVNPRLADNRGGSDGAASPARLVRRCVVAARRVLVVRCDAYHLTGPILLEAVVVIRVAVWTIIET